MQRRIPIGASIMYVLHITAQICSCLLTPLPQVKLDWCTKYKDKNELTTKFRQALDSSGRDMW
jgi:hypothetical protein